MRTVENYELVLSGEVEERLLLTFDWSDLPQIPRAVSSVVFDKEASEFRITFEDKSHWEEVRFPNLPLGLHDMVTEFDRVSVVGLSDGENEEGAVEMFSEVPLVK